jgi:hypothetical protein
MIKLIKGFFQEEDGLGTVEIVIIIAVLVGLALIFKTRIFAFLNAVFDRVFSNTGTVVDNPSAQGQGAVSTIGN